MKDFVIAVFAVLIFLLGLLACILEFIGLIDPEGGEKALHFTFVLTAVFSFLISRFLWKLSRKK